MKKKMFFAFSLAFFLSFVLVSTTFAQTSGDFNNSKEKIAQESKEYIQANVENLNNILSAEQKNNHSLSEVESIIDEYYEKNKLPNEVTKEINQKGITIDDIFPQTTTMEDEPIKLDFNQLISESKNNGDGDVYEFFDENSKTSVYVAETGEVMIFEQSTIAEAPDQSDATTLASFKTTKTQKATGIAYNALGAKLFTLWASGNFRYNGTTVNHGSSDGDYTRHIFGSFMELKPRYLGHKRTEYEGSHLYREVASRLYFESQLGIRWLGLTLKSGTVEAYVGGTKSGNTYGAARRVN